MCFCLQFVADKASGSGLGGYATPISSLIDYLTSGSGSGSGISSGISSLLPNTDRVFMKRRKPADPQELLAEAQIPPTPCPSIEEYVSPVSAPD